MKFKKSSFKERVLNVVKNIPKGKVLTYKEVAQKAGSPFAWRSVGNVLKNNYDISVPCFRVIKSTGEVGNYNRGKRKKVEILRKEGIIIDKKYYVREKR